MKKTHMKVFASFLTLAMIFASSKDAFATNPYNITYSGGEVLSTDNVQIDEPLISGLTPLIQSGATLEYSNSPLWKEGYFKNTDNGTCKKVNYIRIWDNDQISNSDNLVVWARNSQYKIRAQINRVILEDISDLSEDGKGIAVGGFNALGASAFPSVGIPIYSDSSCSTQTENVKGLSLKNDGQVYVEMNLKLYKNDSDEVFTSDKLYFGLTDIDAAQSYKIKNTNNLMSPANMFAISEEALNNPDSTSDLRNMFDPINHYIYSTYHKEQSETYLGEDVNNIFVKIEPETQQQGLDIIFGFAVAAGSGIQYYAQQHTVTYESDLNGDITGITSEDIISGNNASGSTSNPIENYVFKHWIADKIITLDDGTTTISAGRPITHSQLAHIVVDDDLTLTAIHQGKQLTIKYISDEHGEITGIEGEAINFDDILAGSEASPKEKYAFSHWVADVDIVLDDGTEIKSGNPIKQEQIKHIVAKSNITLTAIHETTEVPAIPDTGIMTNKTAKYALEVHGNILISVTIITLASFVFALIRRKKSIKITTSSKF